MKKIIAILAVCALVSVSSAALLFQAPATVNEGEVFNITVISDEASDSFSIGALVLTGHVAYSNNAVNAGFTTTAQPGFAAAANTGNVILTSISGITAAGATDNIAAGTALFTITVTAGLNGSQIVIDDYVGSKSAIGLGSGPNFSTKFNTLAATLEGATITVVPEPMTMALLGLGGLFIRRRRA